jgi:hypothetical protein
MSENDFKDLVRYIPKTPIFNLLYLSESFIKNMVSEV